MLITASHNVHPDIGYQKRGIDDMQKDETPQESGSPSPVPAPAPKKSHKKKQS
jgi:SWI/SNF-related matrix-associated actin-dependent regulator of chromatin subfamily A member 5